jgi:hypothetical protein
MQTSYQIYADRAVCGDAYDINDNTEDITLANASNNTIYFGRMVVQVSGSAGQIDRPSATGQVIAGVARRDINEAQAGFYALQSAVSVRKKGIIWVEVDQDVTPDDAVYMRFAANGARTSLGVCRKDDDKLNGVATADLVTGARFVFLNSFTDKNGVKIAAVDLTLI